MANQDKGDAKIPVGISSCLLGAEVRFDGGHKRDAYINGTLSRYFEFVPLCPEVAIGLGIPREPIRLVGSAGEQARAVGVHTPGLDVTEALRAYVHAVAPGLSEMSGYILKRGSPSCGMEGVKIYSPAGMPRHHGSGIFAGTLMERYPLLPVEEEGRLRAPVVRENFIERVFVFHRWQKLVAGGLSPARLVDFYTNHKLLIMAHSQAAYRRLGRLVAKAGCEPMDQLAERYIVDMMKALRRHATPKANTNVLHDLMGYLEKHLDAQDKDELLDMIENYRLGKLPLIVPITLLNHHFCRHPYPDVERQLYLSSQKAFFDVGSEVQ